MGFACVRSRCQDDRRPSGSNVLCLKSNQTRERMANEHTIGQDRPRRYGVVVPAQADQHARIAGEQEPCCIWPGYLRASVICPRW